MEGLRKALDNLMGKDRNLPLHEQLIKKKHFDDPIVCKFFLIGFCPHELFTHVKSSNIGECHYRHDQQFKIAFENDPNKEKYQRKYEENLISFLESITSEVDMKMKKCLERIEVLPDQVINKEIQEEIEELDQKITDKIKQAELLGEEGKIEESEKIMKEIEQIKTQRNLLTNTKDYPAIYKDRQMKVCEICGALQSAQDNEKRIQTHKEGKIHSAYLKIRQYLDLLKKKKAERSIKDAEMKQKEKLVKELKQREKKVDRDYLYKNYNDNGYNKDDYNNEQQYKKRYDEDYDQRKRYSKSRSKYRSKSRSRSKNKSYSRDKKKYDDRYYNYYEDKYGYKEREKRRERNDRDYTDNRDSRDIKEYRDNRDIIEERYKRDRISRDNTDRKDRRDRDRKEKRDYDRERDRDIRYKRDDRDNSFSYRYERKKEYK